MSAKTKLVAAKVSEEEHAKMHAAARAAGKTVQRHILDSLRRLVRKMETHTDQGAS